MLQPTRYFDPHQYLTRWKQSHILIGIGIDLKTQFIPGDNNSIYRQYGVHRGGDSRPTLQGASLRTQEYETVNGGEREMRRPKGGFGCPPSSAS